MKTKKLTARESDLIAAILAHPTLREASLSLGYVANHCAAELCRKPHLRAALEDVATKAVESAARRLASHADCAANRLVAALTSGMPPCRDMLRVIEIVLERADAYSVQRRLREEIDELRAMVLATATGSDERKAGDAATGHSETAPADSGATINPHAPAV